MKKFLLASALVTASTGCFAQILQLDVVPTNWKLENYMNDNIVVWYTESVCQNGKLTFSDNATTQDKNRFWSTLLSAKATNSEVFVRYESTTCNIESFGVHK